MRKPMSQRDDPKPALPHEHDRESQQPYANEVDDYKHGVAKPPEDQSGREPNPRPKRARTKT